MADLDTLWAELRKANATITTPNVMSRDKFKTYVGNLFEQTYGIPTTEPVVSPDGFITAEKSTPAGRLLNDIIKSWPEDLMNESIATWTNWSYVASAVASTNPKHQDVATKFADAWDKTQGPGIRGYVENLSLSYGSNDQERQNSVAIWQKVMKDEPLTLAYASGMATGNAVPLGTNVQDWLSSLDAKVIEMARSTSTQSTQPQTSVPTSTPTTDVPIEDSSAFDGGTGSGTNVTTTGGMADTSATVIEFFDNNPFYDFMNSLSGTQGFGAKTYEDFGQFINTRYGQGTTFKSSNGETWSAIEAMNWLDNLYKDNPTAFLRVQDDLRQTGYFDQGLPKKGFLDPTTRAAWANFLGDAALNNKTPLEHFVDAKRAVRQGLWDEQVKMNDPATIEANVRDMGMNLIGRNLTQTEFDALLGNVRRWERDFVSGQTFAQQPEEVDLNARIEQYIQNTMRGEFTMANTLQTLDNWKKAFN